MPELPEVETIRRELESAVVGKKIRSVTIFDARVIRQPRAPDFKKGVAGKTIKGVERRGKFLAISLSSGKFLTVHLKMTGQFIYPARERLKETRLTFHLSDGLNLDFRDRRVFGELRLVDDWRTMKFVRGLGPEPAEMSLAEFQQALKGRKSAIKPLLMDQSRIAGIGNLYAAEALFRARIHPARAAATLSAQECARLLKQIKQTLREATEHKGSSVDQYRQLSGEQGGYVKYHKVYDRKDQPCTVCKKTVTRIRLAGRGTYFCPSCQK